MKLFGFFFVCFLNTLVLVLPLAQGILLYHRWVIHVINYIMKYYVYMYIIKIHLSVQLNLFNASSFHHLLRLELSPNARDRKRKRKALTIKAS